jgi:NADPH2:quinone reductase
VQLIRIHEHGDAGVLSLETAEVPRPGPGEALLRIEAIGLNFIEVYHRTGLYKVPLPFTLGSEAAGTVEDVGPGVTVVQAGDRVASLNVRGAYAEYAVADAERLVPLPDRVSTKAAAAVLLQGITAHFLAFSTYPLQRGDTCLVHAAAGGVGLLLCQMAKRRGARVIGTTSTEEKAALAREAGADDVILYTRTNFVDEVKRLMGGKGLRSCMTPWVGRRLRADSISSPRAG